MSVVSGGDSYSGKPRLSPPSSKTSPSPSGSTTGASFGGASRDSSLSLDASTDSSPLPSGSTEGFLVVAAADKVVSTLKELNDKGYE